MKILNITSQCPTIEGIGFMQNIGISKPSLIEFNVKSLIECDLLISGSKYHLVPEPFNPAFIIQHSQNYCIYRPLEKSQKLIFSCNKNEFFQIGYSNLPYSNDYLLLVSNPMDVLVLDTLGHPALFINSYMNCYTNLLHKLKSSFKLIYYLCNPDNINPLDLEILHKHLNNSLCVNPFDISTNEIGLSTFNNDVIENIVSKKHLLTA